MSQSNAAYAVKYGIFVCDDASEPLNLTVTVGKDNEYVDYLHDTLTEGGIADLDPLNQLIMLEEMEEAEAFALLSDLIRSLHRK